VVMDYEIWLFFEDGYPSWFVTRVDHTYEGFLKYLETFEGEASKIATLHNSSAEFASVMLKAAMENHV